MILDKFGFKFLCTCLFFSFLISSCQKDPAAIPEDDVFTKQKREQLGELLLTDVLASNTFLPQVPPYDTSIYWYIQTLYSQATSLMQLDKESPSDNRWTGNWQVYIINNDNQQHAFTLPGGDLFITTGMLKRFEKDYELYYLLTFEAALMYDGHLLDQLKSKYNSLTLINLIEGRPTASGITINNVAAELPGLNFPSEAVKEADKTTVSAICNTSILESTGIVPSLNDPAFQTSKWLQTRETYNDRPSVIQGFADDILTSCGHSLGSGNYQQFVLDVLN